MSVVYLLAYLLKDLTLELFTQPALGESLTHNINLPSGCQQSTPSFLSRAFGDLHLYPHHVRVQELCKYVTVKLL